MLLVSRFLPAIMCMVIILQISSVKTTESHNEIGQFNEKDLRRLRQMLGESKKLAAESSLEMNMLDLIRRNNALKHEGTVIDQNQHSKEGSTTVFRDEKGSSSHYEITGRNLDSAIHTNVMDTKNNSSKPKIDDDKEEDSIAEQLVKHPSDNVKSETRQSLFSPLRFPAMNPTLSNSGYATNPFMNNILHPPTLQSFSTLPALPSLPVLTPQSHRPPKTSIIGNGGGPMALTNDNVVVVNVLSGNY